MELLFEFAGDRVLRTHKLRRLVATLRQVFHGELLSEHVDDFTDPPLFLS